MSPGQARQVARQALERGDLAIARGIAQAFLARNPDDYQARVVLALVAQREGNLDVAAAEAMRAYRSADNAPQRFESAWLSANILASQEKWERSKLWLRRADQAAPNDATKRQVGQAFRMARARSPWSVQLSFSVQPTDNVNNGSDPDAVEDSGSLVGSTENKIGGTEVIGSAAIRYRVSESQTARTDLFAQSYVRLAFPESGFEEISPGSTRRSFDFVTLLGGISHERAIFEGQGPTGIRLAYGGSYFRNEQLNSFVVFDLTQSVRVNDRTSLRFGASFRDESRKDSPAASYISQTISVDLSRQLNPRTALGFGLSHTDYASAAPTVFGYRKELRLSVRHAFANLPIDTDLSLALSDRMLPDFFNLVNPTAGVGRVDKTTRWTLGLTFREADWYGFVPRIEARHSKTDSDRILFDRDSWSVGATLVSRF